jgi:hypothetical protein
LGRGQVSDCFGVGPGGEAHPRQSDTVCFKSCLSPGDLPSFALHSRATIRSGVLACFFTESSHRSLSAGVGQSAPF